MMAGTMDTDPSHPSHLVAGFEAMKDAGELFDYVIKGQDETFSIHSLVLASMSPVFKAMLTANMEESAQREASFPIISDDSMKTIIEYAYTGTLSYTFAELEQLVSAAHYLQMSNLVEFCEEQISRILYPGNCFSWLRIAETLQLSTLLPQVREMMFASYKEVNMSEEFKDAGVSDIVQFVNILSEAGMPCDIVLDIALQWVKHDSPNRSVHTSELVKCVSFEECNTSLLSKVVEENAELLEAQQNVFRSILNESPAVEGDENVIVLGGQWYIEGSIIPRSTVNKDCWLVQDDQLVKFAEVPGDEFKPFHSICQVPQGVLLTGGDMSIMCKLFDVGTRSWLDKANVPTLRTGHASGCLSGKVFLIGGMLQMLSDHNRVDYIDLETNTWHLGPHIPEAGLMPKAVACGSMLFVLLAREGNLYCLDSASMEWTEKSALPISSHQCSMAALDDRLFAVGGYDSINFMYIPKADTWCSLMRPRAQDSNGALVAFKQKLYLIRGSQRDDEVTDVEEYDIATDTWTVAPWELPTPLFLHAAFVLNISV